MSEVTYYQSLNLPNITGVAYVGSTIYAVSYSTNNIYLITSNGSGGFVTNSIDLSAYGNGLHTMISDGSLLYISCNLSANILIFNTSNNTVSSSIALTGTNVHPTGLYKLNNFLYVSYFNTNLVVEIDLSNTTNQTTIATASGPQGITFDGTYFYVSEYNSNNVSKWDVNWNSVQSSFISINNPTGIIFSYGTLFVSSNTSNVTNQYDLNGSPIFTPFANTDLTLPYSQLFVTTFPNTNKLYIIANYATTNSLAFYTYTTDPSCFNEGTKILCLNELGEEQYISIECLKKGDLVKTYKFGYKKIDIISKDRMVNDPTQFIKCMYKMVKTNDNGLLEDLIITGGHSILVDDLREYKEDSFKIFGEQKIEDKYLLLAGLSKDFIKLENNDLYTYYHIALESDDLYKKFGIWANGILTESTDKNNLVKKFI